MLTAFCHSMNFVSYSTGGRFSGAYSVKQVLVGNLPSSTRPMTRGSTRRPPTINTAGWRIVPPMHRHLIEQLLNRKPQDVYRLPAFSVFSNLCRIQQVTIGRMTTMLPPFSSGATPPWSRHQMPGAKRKLRRITRHQLCITYSTPGD